MPSEANKYEDEWPILFIQWAETEIAAAKEGLKAEGLSSTRRTELEEKKSYLTGAIARIGGEKKR